MFRQHWQTMLNKCCLNGPVPTGMCLMSILPSMGQVDGLSFTRWFVFSSTADITCPTSLGFLVFVMSYCLMSPWIQLLKYRYLSSNEMTMSVITPKMMGNGIYEKYYWGLSCKKVIDMMLKQTLYICLIILYITRLSFKNLISPKCWTDQLVYLC